MIMKTFIFLLCTTVFGLTTEKTFSQEQIVIDTDKEVSVDEVFYLIQTQTKYRFLYPEDLFEEAPRVKLKKGIIPLSNLLDKSLSKSNVQYQISDKNTIVIEVGNNSSKLNNVVNQQKIEIRGTIKDEFGNGIPGVNVLEKGTSNGTLADFDGNFSISVTDENAVLEFSYLGYATQQIPVMGKSTVNVTLKTDLTDLDEVVIVGYGTAKKETLTGSVEQVKGEVFEDLAVGSAELALQGRTPGLVVTRNSSRPGSEGIDFDIRGATSVNGVEPLIVIDGTPAIEGAFSSLNPNDIESISVLKGGSASVYGSRAAGGVILVTTKKGKKGKVNVTASSVMRVGTIGIRPPSPTMAQYGQLYLNAVNSDLDAGMSPNFFFWNTTDQLKRIAAGEEGLYNFSILGDVYLSNNGNMFDQMFGDSFSTQHNISISGGSEKSSFRLSAGVDDNVGGLKIADDSSKRYNMSLNHDFEVNKKLNIKTNVSYFHKHFSGPAGGLDREVTTYDAPLFSPKNQHGQWYGNFGGNIAGGRNAFARVVDGGRENQKDEQFKVTSTATYKFNDHLNATGMFSYTKANAEDQIYVTTVPTYNWFGDLAPASINGQSYIQEETGNSSYKLYRGALNYDNTFGDHHVSGLVAVEAEKFERNSLRARRNGFIDYGVYDLNLGATDQAIQTEGGGTEWGFYGYVGRLNYDYKGKYLLELQGRRDGTSRFGEGNKWSSFGNISAGWILSSEDFLKDSNVISFLKVRGGYGQIGSTGGIDNFNYVSRVSFGTTVFGSTASQQAISSADRLASQKVTWERVESKEIGIDYKLFNSKLFGSIDFYQKNNINMLINPILSAIGGFKTTPDINDGVLETNGWEVQLGWRDKIGDFDYSVSANMSDSRNTVKNYDGGKALVEGLNAVGDGEIIEGKPINAYYLYETDGVFANQAEVDAYISTINTNGNFPNVNLRPGDTRIVDKNGDGTIDRNDITYQGDAAPHYVYGINLDFKYKNWDLSTFFQGALDHNILREGYFSRPFAAVWQNQSTTWLDRTWTQSNPNAEFPRLTTNGSLASWNYLNKDFMLQNNRYIRLKSLILGYTLRDIKVGNTNIDNLRLYFSGNDLFEFTNVKDGWDPESQANSNASAYPFMRTWAFGVKVSL
ncbi:hypothetical protein AXE80_03460 [Wenyingzhuangia fucanilytica]|uniref:TonB-dependent receptor plug domain-containing protein n=2 Tax=Wenyingzhuangia fucanilytica TaxID=1790137 RepID=A0A1B1Y3P3_9FLAO|nr:hypothetical protein AXE80_03460 [Wenyingzhuangia fucanilytica]